MADTPIQWTDYVWNPVRGCSPVSPGCKECYAERTAARNLPGMRSPTTNEAFAIMKSDGPHWTGRVELIESKLSEPLHWKKPRRVFVNSMSDLFHENLPDEVIDRVFAVMALCSHITFQVLTKRAERMHDYFTSDLKVRMSSCTEARVGQWALKMAQDRGENTDAPNWDMFWGWPLPNVHLGVSVEDQQRADERIPQLLRTPAAKRFVSYEPALGPVDFDAVPITAAPGFFGSPLGWHHRGLCHKMEGIPYPTLDWGIIGGESGPNARPFHLDWLRSTIRQLKAAGVPLFVKQMGARPVSDNPEDLVWITQLDSKGGNWDVWPEEFRVREFPK